MKKIKIISVLTVLLVAFASCSTEPEPIAYGKDNCHFCEMTIVSKAHSAQGVSEKGKQFKYDAIECMVNDVIKNDRQLAVKRVADFSLPGNMIAVEAAHFVQNDSISSPMGENLAAIKENETTAGETQELFTWNELKSRFLGENTVTTKH